MSFRTLLLASLVLLPWTVTQAGRTKEFTPEDRAWWSFQPIHDPALPTVQDSAWPESPVDYFILASLEKSGLSPAPRASRPALIRRLSFDLTGMGPSQEEVQAFVNDPSEDAWPRLVDRLLASPRYGERQARLWLDLVRYADSDGYKSDDYRPDAWRYRDYVITAFNQDRPYDQFVREQLAGDELYPEDPQALIATGYLRHWIYEYNNRDVAGQWSVILNDITDTTADVFMGLGLQCARCHDHKFDPLLQADYFRLQAFFAPIGVRDGTDILTHQERAARLERVEKWDLATADIRQRIATVQAPQLEKSRLMATSAFPPETQALLEKPLSDRTPLEKQLTALAWRQIEYEWDRVDSKIKGSAKEELVALRKELAAFDALKPAPPPTAQTAGDIGPLAPPVLIPRREGEGAVAPAFPTLLQPGPAEIVALPDSTGRRSALARWITRPDNPLTARVMVNRVWQQHFGRGLSSTASDFGMLGERPSHPELLDWLAHRFVADGWSLKHLHRLILTSAAWRQGHISPETEKAKQLDPENRLVWRWTTRRLEAEQIRDSIFHAAGELDLTPGGPGVDTQKPRRTIYTKVLRNVRDDLLAVFDAPQNFQSTPVRDTSTTATQSLFLANSRFMRDRAAAMARSLTKIPSAEQQIEKAWWATAGRAPSTDEREESIAFLAAPVTEISSLEPEGFISESMPQRNGKAAVLAPGSAMERLAANLPQLPDSGFSFETVALLRSVKTDETLRPLAGRWSRPQEGSGWTVGISGTQSTEKPRMLVLQLRGTDASGQPAAERVLSDLTLQLDRSYYLGFSFQPATPEHSGTVTFLMKDLANEDEPLRLATVPHPIAHLELSEEPVFLGASSSFGPDLWDGLIDEVKFSTGILTETRNTLLQPDPAPETLAYWQFESDAPLTDSLTGKKSVQLPPSSRPSSTENPALTDLCLALLSSSAMLYVE